MRGWETLRKAATDLLAALEPVVRRIDLGPDKGVFYRLQTPPADDKASAAKLCGALKSLSIECFVTRIDAATRTAATAD